MHMKMYGFMPSFFRILIDSKIFLTNDTLKTMGQYQKRKYLSNNNTNLTG